MTIDQALEREIRLINRVFRNHAIDAGIKKGEDGESLVCARSLILHRITRGDGQRIADIERLLPELSEDLSRLRGQVAPVRLRRLPLALETPHFDPAPLDWRAASLRLPAGRMLAGRSWSWDGGKQEVIDLGDTAHTLIAGMTGAGKSTLLKMMVLSLAISSDPAGLRLVLVDLKNSDLVPLADLPHVDALAVLPEDAAAVVAEVHGLLRERIKLHQSAPRVVLVVDELRELALVPGVLGQLSSILSLGRALGVHVVAATQHPTAREIGSVIKANFACRLVGLVAGARMAEIAADRGETGAELLPGNGAFLRVQGPTVERFQAYHVDDQAARVLAAAVVERWGAKHRQPARHDGHFQALELPGRGAGLPVAMQATAPVVRPPSAQVPPALAAVFAEYDDGDDLRRGGMAAALRALWGAEAPTTGRAYQDARNQVTAFLAVWRAVDHVRR